MIDHSTMKLGKATPKYDDRTLQLANYLALPHPPPAASWTYKCLSNWGMMKNDELGDCTIAAAAHFVQAWTANASGKEVTISDSEILKAYEAVGGYNPADPNTDQGCVELDVLKYWHNIGIGGDKIGAYTSTEPENKDHIQAAIWMFGGAYLGLALPLSAQKQATWSVPLFGPHGSGKPGSWGGHAVTAVAYDTQFVTCVTWGALKKMTWNFFITYCDEAYAILSGDWVKPSARAPSGFDLVALQSDLKLVK